MMKYIISQIQRAQEKHEKLLQKEIKLLNSNKKFTDKELEEACENTKNIEDQIRHLKLQLYDYLLNVNNSIDDDVLNINIKDYDNKIPRDVLIKISSLIQYFELLCIRYEKIEVIRKIIEIYLKKLYDLESILSDMRTDSRDFH